jgi:geranylgeranyl reductase family protein
VESESVAAGHDVIVVGGGPAGAMTAWHLAFRGIDVGLIEKKALPRYKPCGGGISGRTRKELPFSVDPVLEQEIDGLAFNFWGKWIIRRHTQPIAWMAMRSRFDEYLVRQAESVGATVYRERAMKGTPRIEGDRVTVPTVAGDLTGRVLVGADGASSAVARAFGLMPNMRAMVALEHEVACPPDREPEWRRLVEIDFSYQPWGYGWVFPKADHVSVGVAVPPAAGKTIREAVTTYRLRRELAGNRTIHSEGHKIPTRGARDTAHHDRVLLVGDAAGLTDEFSAEGIFYAVSSGRLAAEAVERYLRRGDTLASYTAAIDRVIQPELDAARGISRLFFTGYRLAPWALRWGVEHIDYYTRVLFQVQAGETDYVEIQRTWPFLRPLWSRLNAGSLAV